jgi:acetylornithine deacetylase/succinyl-diaminopimelate desuccinylase-like protein
LHTIKTDEVRALLREAVAIDSVNHHFRENRAGEADLCDWVEFFFQKNGIPFQSQSIRGRQRNLVATIAGQNTARTLCFEAHLDTTTARGMSVHPFGAEEIEGAIYGRGTCDCKAALAAMLVAFQSLAASGTPPPQTVVLAATLDKEVGLTGIQRLLSSGVRPSAAVIGAPTNLAVARCCRGCLRWRIAIGESPQSYNPSTRNAIADAVALITQLEKRGEELARKFAHPLLGPVEVRPWRIRASGLEGFLPPHCAVDFDCYTVPGCASDAVLEEVNDLVSHLEAEDPAIKISVEPPFLNEPPVELPETSAVVRSATNACRTVLGSAEAIGLQDSGHLNRFVALGVEAIALGPGDPKQARTADEHVPVEQLAPAAQIYLSLMRSGI